LTDLCPLVIGAGVAGLAMANAWQQSHGQTPMVCERVSTVARSGFGFLLLPRGLIALRALGFNPETEMGAIPITHYRQISPSGRPVGAHRFEPGTMALDRNALILALLNRLESWPLECDRPFEGFVRERGRVVAMRFQGGEELAANLVFAADGAGSVCRRAVLDQGNGGWLPGTVARVHEIVGLGRDPALVQQLGGCLFKIGEPRTGLAAGMLPLSDTSLVWYVQFDTHRFGVPEPDDLLPFLDRLLPHYPECLRDLIASPERGPAHHWRPLDLDPPPHLVEANVALLGDAAHPLLPFTSQGANLALEDAWILRDLLRGSLDPNAIAAALLAYEQQRLPLIQHYVAAGRSMSDRFIGLDDDLDRPPVAS
jgi:2-polyprenyl-6-methoxyphenol hydroxylase-like FAD-dependent oxidoreductase